MRRKLAVVVKNPFMKVLPFFLFFYPLKVLDFSREGWLEELVMVELDSLSGSFSYLLHLLLLFIIHL